MPADLKDRNAVTLDQYRRYTDQLTDVEIRRIAAQAQLDRLRNERMALGRPPAPAHLDEMVRDAFYAYSGSRRAPAALDAGSMSSCRVSTTFVWPSAPGLTLGGATAIAC